MEQGITWVGDTGKTAEVIIMGPGTIWVGDTNEIAEETYPVREIILGVAGAGIAGVIYPEPGII